MKKLPEVTSVIEVPNQGLISLLGKRVTFYCLNYIYTGTLTGVNEYEVELTDPAIVYETGPYTDKKWKDAQPLPNKFFVVKSSVEGYGEVK